MSDLKDNPILHKIILKMCECAGYNYDDIDWSDGSHLKLYWKSVDDVDRFKSWMKIYVRSLKVSELRQIAEYPHLIYRRKKAISKLVDEFESNFGFRYPEEK
jgi:hypothetical protein